MKGNAAHKDPRNYFGTTPCPTILMTQGNIKKGRLSPFNTDDKKRVVMRQRMYQIIYNRLNSFA